ncbi:MAG: TlyA family RNA methyltransferase [Anaerovoracaceae bacterium]|nr:TlyA family RNA methyltransferase [Bacillota bacterium]MDY5906913.1 TlyA family RNA methyltransferase [Anaerovoracaceae bacterium]
MKERLDVLLVSRGYYPSRERAKAAVMEGCVYIGGSIYDKPGTPVDVDAELEVRGESCPFVGRGGFKLAKAVEVFGLDLNGAVGMDVGASTGGFTDCMLQNGAVKVYSIDVGYGQLDWKLRTDERVVNMEKCNFRYLDPADIPDRMDLISIDVSFISLKLMFPVAVQLLKDDGDIACLVKPQFEAGRSQVGKKGIVKDPAVHLEVIQNAAGYALENGLVPQAITFSPISGAKGNIEYLMHLRKGDTEAFDFEAFSEKARAVVEESHARLEK